MRALSGRILTGSRLLALLFAVGMGALAYGCHGTDNPLTGNKIRATSNPPGWTVIIYAPGRNASGNVTQAMTAAVATSQLTVYEENISLTNVPAPAFGGTNRIQIFLGTQYGPGSVAEGGQAMIDPAEFESFVQFAVQSAPSPHFCLVLLGDGGFPVNGLGSDEVAPITTLDLASIDAALTTVQANTGLAAFDIILADQPFGLTMESLSVFQKHCNNSAFGFASCAPPPTGIDLSDLSTQIKNSPNIAPSALATAITKEMFAWIRNNGPAIALTFSETTMFPTVGGLATAVGITTFAKTQADFDKFAADLVADMGALPGTVAMIGSARRTVSDFDQHFGAGIIDAGEFASIIANITSAGAVSATTKADAAVFAADIGPPILAPSNYPTSRGVGVYFPHCKSLQAPTFTTAAAALLTACPNWGTFLSTYYSKIATAAVVPTVTLAVPGVLSASSPTFTMSGTVSPANSCHDVTVLVTKVVGGKDQVIGRITIGVPDPALPSPVGAWSFTGPLKFHAMTDGVTLPLTTFTPLARNKNQTSIAPPISSTVVFAIDADVHYTNGASTVTVPGFFKTEFLSPALGEQFVSFTPIGTNGAFGHDDVLTSGGIGYKVFPRTVTVSGTGVQTATAQATTGYVAPPTGSLVYIPPTPGAYKFWVIAETVNGDIGFTSLPVTITP